MNRIPRMLSFVLIAVLFALACTKKYTKPADVPPPTYNTGGPTTFPVIPMNELFKDFRYNPEVHCIIAGVRDSVTLSKGTSVVFYPWSFEDAAGDTITGAVVCVSAVEVYNTGDMIQNRTTSVSKDGDLLTGRGQVYISATMDGQKVYVKKYKVLFKQPKPYATRKDLYYGSSINKDSVATWTIADSTGPGTTALSTNTDSLYVYDSVSDLGWVGCARVFDTTTTRTDINVALASPGFDSKNTSVYVVFPSINAVAVASYAKATNTFLLGGDAKHKVPTGMTVHVIVISKREGNYFYFEQKGVTVTDGLYISAPLTSQTFDYIRGKLWGL